MNEGYGTFVKVPDDSGAFTNMLSGLKKDIGLLPTNVPTYTKAYCIDTGELYIFEATTGQWYLQ